MGILLVLFFPLGVWLSRNGAKASVAEDLSAIQPPNRLGFPRSHAPRRLPCGLPLTESTVADRAVRSPNTHRTAVYKRSAQIRGSLIDRIVTAKTKVLCCTGHPISSDFALTAIPLRSSSPSRKKPPKPLVSNGFWFWLQLAPFGSTILFNELIQRPRLQRNGNTVCTSRHRLGRAGLDHRRHLG
jgi:hypothetical protein